MSKNSFYNIVVLGKTGTGKSSLINYLFGRNIANAGLGRPQTGYGLHKYQTEINGIGFNFFDSWGIEVKNHTQWIAFLEKEFEKRNYKKYAYEWMHSVVYCLTCASRFEDIDIEIIRKCIASGYKVIIALTWADAVSEKVLEEYQNTILDFFTRKEVVIVPICSVEGETRFGLSKKFGNKDIMNEIVDSFWLLIVRTLPKRCTYLLESFIEQWETEQIQLINQMTSGFEGYFTLNSTHEKIKENSEKFTLLIQDKSKEIIKMESVATFSIFDDFSKALNITSELDDIDFELNPDGLQVEGHFGNFVFGAVLSGLGTFFLLEIFGFSKMVAQGSMSLSLKDYVNNLKIEIDKLENKFIHVLENNIVIKLQRRKE